MAPRNTTGICSSAQQASNDLDWVASWLIEYGIAVNANKRLFKEDANTDKIDASSTQIAASFEAQKLILDTDGNIVLVPMGAYEQEFKMMELNADYTLRMVDGALVQFYEIYYQGSLVKQRVAFYQSAFNKPFTTVDDIEEAQFATTIEAELSEVSPVVAFRFDYDPDSRVDELHPSCHLHLGGYEDCRIPVKSPLNILMFFEFLTKNFYHSAWEDLYDSIRQKYPLAGRSIPAQTLSKLEGNLLHINF